MPESTTTIQQQMPPQAQQQAQPQWQQGHQPSYQTGQPHPQAQTVQDQSQQQHVYYPQSFPQAPAAVFPDAPTEEINKSVEKEEQKEALLIEL